MLYQIVRALRHIFIKKKGIPAEKKKLAHYMVIWFCIRDSKNGIYQSAWVPYIAVPNVAKARVHPGNLCTCEN